MMVEVIALAEVQRTGVKRIRLQEDDVHRLGRKEQTSGGQLLEKSYEVARDLGLIAPGT
jgi:hypothetical protein